MKTKWDQQPVADQKRVQDEKLQRYINDVIAPFSPMRLFVALTPQIKYTF